MIIGVTGSYASGKDTFAEILQEMNFYHISFSDILREKMKAERREITRDSLIEFANKLREKEGADVLARLALEKVKDGENYVFTSIRNPGEVRTLQKREDFLLVNIVAPEKLRLKRIRSRNREKDPRTLKELRAKEALEKSADPKAQQLHLVAQMARVILRNDSTLERLREKAGRLVKDWLYRLQESRPDWDHYFMNIAEQVKKRCNCLSARKGAIIVRDQMIISTGYNGTPKGIKHCNEGSCPRCTARHLGKIKSGDYSLPCICAHAEENAIVQAAYNGASTKGAIMYTTFTPCANCARMIINAGLKEVVAKIIYPDELGNKLLEEAGIKFRVLK